MDEQEELYKTLYERALEIVSCTFGKGSLIPLKELAHDITVDFLYFSKSFPKTFDAAKGDLIKFFASYVRKKSLGITIRTSKRNRKILQIYGDPAYRDTFEVKVECRDRILAMCGLLRGRYLIYGRMHNRKKVSLERLFFMNIVSFLERGRTHKDYLARRMGVSVPILREALAAMQQILEEGIRNGEA